MKSSHALGVVCALALFGCKKQVPTDIVQKSMSNALRHAPATAAAMCGNGAKGLTNTRVTVTKRGENNTGTVHVKGTSMFGQGIKDCEGDVEYAYTYSQKSSGPSRRRNTTTTWYLDHLKLVAVQTPGVTLRGAADEKADDDE